MNWENQLLKNSGKKSTFYLNKRIESKLRERTLYLVTIRDPNTSDNAHVDLTVLSIFQKALTFHHSLTH